MSVRRMLLCSAMLLTIAGGRAAAQTNDEIFPQFQWNFSTPGARANAMGRTFIGLADDASAAITNPAGLVSLTRPQVYVEFKNTDVKVNRLAAVDSLFTLNPTTFSTNVSDLSFFNVSAPIGKRAAVGFTFHQYLNNQETFHLAPRPVPDVNNPSKLVSNGTALFSVDGSSDFKGASYAGTIAVMITNQLRAGVTVAANTFDASATATRFRSSFGAAYPGNITAISETGIIANQTQTSGSDTQLSANFGLLFKPNDMVSVGFDYTRNPSFNLDESFFSNPGFNNNVNQPLTAFSGFTNPTVFSINVPNRFGFGVSAHPMDKLLVGADVVRVQYSSLAKNTLIVLSFSDPTVSSDKFSIDDATEVHFGGEYNVYSVGSTSAFVRAGVFTNPDHSTKFSATIPDNTTNSVYNAIYNLLPRETQVVGTFGAGVTVGLHFQVDAAYVWKKEAVVSAAVRF